VEEPDLGKDDRDRGQDDRDGVPRRHDQRQQPDEVLRREDLREGKEARDRGGERDRQAPVQVARARVQQPDGDHRGRFEHQ